MNKFKIFASIFLMLASCKADKSPQIGFSSDSTKIVVAHLGEAELYQIRQLKEKENLIMQVYQSKEDSLEKEIKGKISISGDSLVFTPNQPLEKGSAYMVNTLIGANFGKTEDILKSDVGYKVKTLQKELLR
ncbi:hypothetical protein [Pedobacter montanisoli]|uniref:Copper resistance protein NlpE n=1 Tax=Pedobacter montanisoli TaxID=2923277 RepID=A0ABS9ZTE5_9SPHI|nr:hypothetical protein [Pedobacter montanisoli]MCJ0741642.1 hypothetical protein [Pedobacter montanisoli]